MSNTEKKLEIKVGLKEPHVMSRGQLQGLDSVTPIPEVEVEERLHPAKLINKMNHPIQLSYNGIGMMLSPREKVEIANLNKLGSLPRGVMAIPLKK